MDKEDELYNLLKDPKESENLIDKEPELAKSFYLRILDHIVMEKKYETYLRIKKLRDKIKRLKVSGVI